MEKLILEEHRELKKEIDLRGYTVIVSAHTSTKLDELRRKLHNPKTKIADALLQYAFEALDKGYLKIVGKDKL